jgi:hypothetical protein
MAEDATVSPREIKKIAERALVLQSHLLRRAWGALYAALSFSMFVSIFVSPTVSVPSFSSEATIILRFALNMAASGTASIAILWKFKRVRDTAEIRSAIVDRRWSEPLGHRFVVSEWIAIYESSH